MKLRELGICLIPKLTVRGQEKLNELAMLLLHKGREVTYILVVQLYQSESKYPFVICESNKVRNVWMYSAPDWVKKRAAKERKTKAR